MDMGSGTTQVGVFVHLGRFAKWWFWDAGSLGYLIRMLNDGGKV